MDLDANGKGGGSLVIGRTIPERDDPAKCVLHTMAFVHDKELSYPAMPDEF